MILLKKTINITNANLKKIHMFLQPQSEFKIRNATEFLDYIQSSLSNLYLFTAKSSPWADDSNPDTILFSEAEKRAYWDDISFLKKIASGDAIYGIRRIDWTSGNFYQKFDDIIDLREEDFYVLTSENNIYICVDNNNGGASTEKPVHNTEEVVKLSDGYAWKFVSNVETSLLNKFIVDDFIPFVPNQEIIDGVQPGTIETLIIEDGGFGYQPNLTTENENELSVFIQGNGTQIATAVASIVGSQGAIVSATISNPGNGYTFGPGIPFAVALRQVTTSGINQTAYGIATTDLDGNLFSLQVVNRGQGYNSGFATIVQSSAEGFAETDFLGRVINVGMRIGTPGENFRKATAIVVGINLDGDLAQIRPIISPEGGYGSDPLLQLAAHNILISVSFGEEEIDEFRKIGLLDNPLNFNLNFDSDGFLESGQDEFLTIPFADAKYRAVLNESNETFIDGEDIRGATTGLFGKNLHKINNNIIRYNSDDSLFDADEFEFEVGEQIVGISSGAVATVSEIIAPDVDKYSGQLYHINNFKPSLKTEEQQVLITFVLKY